MDNWYILRVQMDTPDDGGPDLFFYEMVEWLGDEPLKTDVDLDNDWDLYIPAGTFEIIESKLTEDEADKIMCKLVPPVSSN